MTSSASMDRQLRLLAAIAYGESSPHNNAKEMAAIASVMVRQRDARGYKTIEDFVKSEKSFSFVVSDGNPRYARFMKATPSQVENDGGMRYALIAAENALSGGADESHGAYFWDGIDIKTNYKNHFKVRYGIKFSAHEHNIYGIAESTKVLKKTKTVITYNRARKVVRREVVELDRTDHIYVSTAAYGGTIFWKHNEKTWQSLARKHTNESIRHRNIKCAGIKRDGGTNRRGHPGLSYY